MRRYLVTTAVAAVAVVLAAPSAFAGKGGNGNNGVNSSSTSSIVIATIDGTSMAAAPTVSPTPSLGDALTFATSIQSLAGWQYPMVAVTCYQDVNGDGKIDTSISGPDIVYSQLGTPDGSFTLGGYSSIWTLRGGGDAICRADLDAYGWKAGKESAAVLATTGVWPATG